MSMIDAKTDAGLIFQWTYKYVESFRFEDHMRDCHKNKECIN